MAAQPLARWAGRSLLVLWLAACGPSGAGGQAPSTPLPGPVDPVKDGVWTAIGAGLGDGALINALEAGEAEILEFSAPRNQLSPKGLRALLHSPRCRNLRRLNLSSNPLGDEGLRTLVEGWPPQLRELQLADVGASSAALQTLAQHQPQLDLLVLGHNPLGEGAGALLASFSRLQRLSLERAGLGPAELRALIAASGSPQLDLRANPGGGGGLRGLSQISPRISSLDLRGTGLGAEDLRVLAALPAPGLLELHLDIPRIDAAALGAVIGAPWFAQLQRLGLGADHAPAEARRALIAAWEAGGRDGRGLDIQRRDLR